MDDCIFCKITSGQQSADVIDEDEKIMVFKDIKPSAPVHLLIVPKKHIASVIETKDEDEELLGGMILKAKDVADSQGLKGYKLVFNVGREGGQLVDHLHLHLLGGWTDK
ncbi:MAG: histidine triad nucleotide-binding protein [Candidatus Niyogibacteria bacterium CG10_big_fil_rev_8_21_14_0_10_42_19]|uniref:Histidine triad nucleotide-binding protein n=1 Tax=Candidatus Niyogibacteria bacterium CG10_big_fil_rev_8_21_14_0_10_42_19 TaxID=1974725 RepID=A0A2H0TG66_9BACT|nr:MAG: histidine triad nucleotide-binding protein [Candidatus Niyogibacteria bacterium CG10_big_fil_rev_8_21_14_0_10_42_19]